MKHNIILTNTQRRHQWLSNCVDFYSQFCRDTLLEVLHNESYNWCSMWQQLTEKEFNNNYINKNMASIFFSVAIDRLDFTHFLPNLSKWKLCIPLDHFRIHINMKDHCWSHLVEVEESTCDMFMDGYWLLKKSGSA